MTSSEVKLDVLANTVKEMMQTISRKDKLVVQRSHVPIVPEQTRINVPKHFAAHPWYHGLDNDCFMYSIHNVVKDEVPTQLVEEPSTDMMCMFDDISFHCWEEEDQLQFKQDSQSVYSDYDNNDQNAEDLGVSVQTLPLCFSSFKFLRDNSKPVVNSEEGKSSDGSVNDVIDDIEVVLDPGLHSPSPSEFQTPDESSEPEEKFESVECNFVPLGYNSFQILKETLEQMLKDKHIESQEISFESMQQSCQSFQDPIVDRLDDLCCQNHFSFASHELKRSYDLDMVRQSFLCFDSTTVFFSKFIRKTTDKSTCAK
jgi:D-ribose pyranose/furanose isomerase RbsD